MTDQRDPASRSDEALIRELEQAGYAVSIWYRAKNGGQVFAGSSLADVARMALAPKVKS
jgi:hypothetical protein